MQTKAKLLKAAAICDYVFTALWFIITAGFFALSNNLYWLFLVFALVSLYNGFVTTSVADQAKKGELSKIDNIKFIVSWVISLVSPVSFVLCAVAYFIKDKQSDENSPAKNEKLTETAAKIKKVKPFYLKTPFLTACISLVLIFVFGFSAMLFETSGFGVKVTDFTLTK